MKLAFAYKRIINYLWHQRRNLFSVHFFRTIKRVVLRHFNHWQKISPAEFENNLQVIEKRPWNLHFELTNLCNANCIFCAYQYQKRSHSVMTDEIFNKSLDDYCRMGGGNIVVCGVVGDALVDKNIIARVQAMRERKEIAGISITTNGIGLKQSEVTDLLLSGVNSITISTGPWDQHLYAKIFRTGSYNKMKSNVSQMLKENHRLGSPVSIKLSFRSNLSMKKTLLLEDYRKIKHYPHLVEFNTDYDTWGNAIQANDLLKGMTLRPQIKLEREPCQWFYHGPVIFPTGDVGVCGCRDYNAEGELILGNILENNLMDLWQSKKMQRLRSGFYKADFPDICKNCTNYVNLDIYRRKQGSNRAKIVLKRLNS